MDLEKAWAASHPSFARMPRCITELRRPDRMSFGGEPSKMLNMISMLALMASLASPCSLGRYISVRRLRRVSSCTSESSCHLSGTSSTLSTVSFLVGAEASPSLSLSPMLASFFSSSDLSSCVGRGGAGGAGCCVLETRGEVHGEAFALLVPLCVSHALRRKRFSNGVHGGGRGRHFGGVRQLGVALPTFLHKGVHFFLHKKLC